MSFEFLVLDFAIEFVMSRIITKRRQVQLARISRSPFIFHFSFLIFHSRNLCVLLCLYGGVLGLPFYPPPSHKEHRGRTARLRPQPNDQVARPGQYRSGLALPIAYCPLKCPRIKTSSEKQEVVGLSHRGFS